MDACLTGEAEALLRALALVFRNSGVDGFLIGHKRGRRFYVEKAFSSPKGFFANLGEYRALNELFAGRIIGFFSFRKEAKRSANILQPAGLGKLFLEIRANSGTLTDVKPYLIDYDGSFFLEPIPLHRRKAEKK